MGYFTRLCRHDPVQFQIRREMIHKRQDDISIKKQPFSLSGMRHIGQLMRRDIELLCKNCPVTGCLIEYR